MRNTKINEKTTTSPLIERITITGIHGTRKTIDVVMEDNTLILVGENGSGKTTFLRILFNILAGQWRSLVKPVFDTATVRINGENIVVKYSEIKTALGPDQRRMLRNVPQSMRNALLQQIESAQAAENDDELRQLSQRYGIPLNFLFQQSTLFDPDSTTQEAARRLKISAIREQLGSQVLYLPTYRRIERELKSIMEGYDDSEHMAHSLMRPSETSSSYFVELVKFGMRDVGDAIKRSLNDLREFQRQSLNDLTLKYLGDIVSGAYIDAETSDFAFASETAIESVLARMDESILPAGQRSGWLTAIREAKSEQDQSEHNKIIRHYFLKILKFQESLQALEQNIVKFCNLCNAYMPSKQFVYDSSTFTFTINTTDGDSGGSEVQLGDLSSGEKQVVSLFSHLYLSGQAHYFVLIDEPELSLSVPWQKRFLTDIRKGVFCSGLVAVTHSPFTYDNELRQYAHSLGEFTNQW